MSFQYCYKVFGTFGNKQDGITGDEILYIGIDKKKAHQIAKAFRSSKRIGNDRPIDKDFPPLDVYMDIYESKYDFAKEYINDKYAQEEYDPSHLYYRYWFNLDN